MSKTTYKIVGRKDKILKFAIMRTEWAKYNFDKKYYPVMYHCVGVVITKDEAKMILTMIRAMNKKVHKFESSIYGNDFINMRRTIIFNYDI